MGGWLTDAILVFVCSFGLAAFAGLASLLRAEVTPTPLKVASAMLNSGLLGLGLALLWYERFRENVYALVGSTVLAGMGGASFVEFVLILFRNTFVRFLSSSALKEAIQAEDRNDKDKEKGGEKK